MSEYQYIAFQAVDKPLTDKQLEFAHKQSSRAEIDQWSFRNEYNFGNFRGDANKLMKNGFDVHLHFANFGIRTIMLRLPDGLPFDKKLVKQYLSGEMFTWNPDSKGPAGTLTISPEGDAGSFDEIWDHDFEDRLQDAINIRTALIQGDSRALYVLWLCNASLNYFDDGDEYEVEDEECGNVIEPPIPHGMQEAIKEYSAFCDFFCCDWYTLSAAAELSPIADAAEKKNNPTALWIQSLSEKDCRQWLSRFLADEPMTVRTAALTEIRASTDQPVRPTISGNRKIGTIRKRGEELAEAAELKQQKNKAAKAKRDAEKKEAERQKRMKLMVADPDRFIQESTKLVEQRGTDNYRAAADILFDLREAIGGETGKTLARHHAAHLTTKHPTLTRLKSFLRKRDLV